MKLTDFLSEEAICADLKSNTKEDMINELVDLLISSGSVDKKHKKKIIEVIMARESLGSTAVGQGIAIPHAKCDCVDELIGCLGISKEGVDFDSLDGDPAHIFFMLVAPIDSAGPHLKALAKISKMLKDKYMRDSIRSIDDAGNILKMIQQEDERLSAS